MKEVKIVAHLFVLILLVSTFVYAAGSSGNSDDDDSSDSAEDSDNRIRMDCENKSTPKERIKCRMINKEAVERARVQRNIEEVHESCRNLNTTSKENCKRLYMEIKECYNKQGREKDRCFKLKTGFATSAVSGQGVNKEAARKYLVTLLYELEERVEDKEEAGVITSEQAADLITKILAVKEAILNNASGSQIRPLIRELKQAWRAVFGSENVPSPNNTGTNSTTINNTGTNFTTNNTLNTTTNST